MEGEGYPPPLGRSIEISNLRGLIRRSMRINNLRIVVS